MRNSVVVVDRSDFANVCRGFQNMVCTALCQIIIAVAKRVHVLFWLIFNFYVRQQWFKRKNDLHIKEKVEYSVFLIYGLVLRKHFLCASRIMDYVPAFLKYEALHSFVWIFSRAYSSIISSARESVLLYYSLLNKVFQYILQFSR